jgi:hypothetical protein
MARIVGKPNADDVKRVAVAALVAALDDGKDQAKKKPGLTGMRAVATGAVLYTAGKAAFNGRRFINERLEARDDQQEDDEGFEEDEELEEEPVAEEDEDFEEPEDDDEELSVASEPPVHPDASEDEDADEDEDEDDEAGSRKRSSRKRTPVGRR